MMRAGLDNAILGYLNSDEPKVDGARIAQLLAHGAHALAAEGDEAVREGEAFQREVRTPFPCRLHQSRYVDILRSMQYIDASTDLFGFKG